MCVLNNEMADKLLEFLQNADMSKSTYDLYNEWNDISDSVGDNEFEVAIKVIELYKELTKRDKKKLDIVMQQQ